MTSSRNDQAVDRHRRAKRPTAPERLPREGAAIRAALLRQLEELRDRSPEVVAYLVTRALAPGSPTAGANVADLDDEALRELIATIEESLGFPFPEM